MPDRNVNLTDHLDRFIEAGVTSGRFADANEVVREGLRLLEQREHEDEAKLEWLRSAAADGFGALDRGESTTFHSKEELAGFFQEVHEEVMIDLATKRA